MINNLRVTVLVENTVRNSQLLGQHGLALWIEADNHKVLFDTGRAEALARNAARLNVPLEEADSLVLSHGHYDHTGGLELLLRLGVRTDAYFHPAALRPKFAQVDGCKSAYVGMSEAGRTALRIQSRESIETCEPTQVAEGIYLTGEIPRRTEYEDNGGAFFLDEACTSPDPLLDDQALYIETPAGLVVVLGCAHAGVVNTLDYIADLTGKKKIHAVLGGNAPATCRYSTP